MGCSSSTAQGTDSTPTRTAAGPPKSSFAELFFDGRPAASKVSEMVAMMDDSFRLSFVGPYAGAATGISLTKEMVPKAIGNIAGACPDLTFNPEMLVPTQHADGGWAANIIVTGLQTAGPFTPNPKLPAVEVKDPPTAFKIGPEEFKVWCDASGKGLKLEIKCLHEGSLVGPPGIYVALGGKLPTPPPEMATLKGFATGFMDKTTANFAAPECTFNPPGAPPMPIDAFLGMMPAMTVSFPNWESRFLGAEKQEDGTWKVKTQQAVGPMVADLKLGGPFPDLPLDKVPASWKTGTGATFPVEVGTYKLSEDGTKVLSGTYDGTIDESYGGGSQEMSAEVKKIWNKKGDQSDCGFGCMFQIAGIAMPAPPA